MSPDALAAGLLVALGVELSVSRAGIFDLGAWAFVWLGGAAAALAAQRGLGDAGAVLAGLLAAAAARLVLGRVLLRLSAGQSACALLGLAGAVEAFAASRPGWAAAAPRGSLALAALAAPWPATLTFGLLCAAVWGGLRRVRRSRLGRAWTALADDELAAACSGLPARRLKLWAFTAAGGVAGAAGALLVLRDGAAAADPYCALRSAGVFAVGAALARRHR